MSPHLTFYYEMKSLTGVTWNIVEDQVRQIHDGHVHRRPQLLTDDLVTSVTVEGKNKTDWLSSQFERGRQTR